MKDNNQRDNSLFALEQGLLGAKISQQQSHQPATQKRKRRRREEAQAFDLGEPIELQYNGEAFPTATPEAMSFSAPNSFASELEDESLPFEVEAFQVDEEVVPVSQPITPQPKTPVQPAIQQEVTPKPMEVQPVKATVVPPSEMPLKSARPVEQHTTVELTSSKEKLSDAEAFAMDLQAILNGEKTYDAEQKQVVTTSPPAQPTQAPTSHPHDIFEKGQTAIPTSQQKPVEPEPVPMSRSHAVFDQMGKNMAHATDFDQGTVDLALEMRFDEFDRILDDETDSTEEETYTALGLSETDVTEEADQLYPPELEMEQLLSDSQEYSGAFVAAAPSSLPTRQYLTNLYNNNGTLLGGPAVIEIQRLSTGGTAAGPAGTKALTDRQLMDHPAMVVYATGPNFNNWETLPKPTRLQVASYQWVSHNPAGGVDMSNKPGYWKARSIDANSTSATAAASRQAIYDRDRDIWISTLSEPTAAAIANIPPANIAFLTLDTNVRQILQRIFALLHLGLQYRNGATPYQAWTQHVAVALSHGGRINVKIPQNTGDVILNWIFIDDAIKNAAGVKTRSSSTHNIKTTKDGVFEEKKVLFKLVGMTHYGLNLAVGGIGNPDVNGNPILPNGSYGHLYMGYRKPKADQIGGLLIGVENDEYGKTNPLGHTHTAAPPTTAEMSPTGGLKIDRIGNPAGAGDSGFMLIDLTAVANYPGKLANVMTNFHTANAGGAPTIQAMAQRLAGAIDPTLF